MGQLLPIICTQSTVRALTGAEFSTEHVLWDPMREEFLARLFSDSRGFFTNVSSPVYHESCSLTEVFLTQRPCKVFTQIGFLWCKPKAALQLMFLPHSRQIYTFSPVWLLWRVRKVVRSLLHTCWGFSPLWAFWRPVRRAYCPKLCWHWGHLRSPLVWILSEWGGLEHC